MTRLTDATPDAIAHAATLLRDGQLVAFPTETVYGLGADATNPRAVAGIFAAKGRPMFNPLIAHVSSVQQAMALARMTEAAHALARAFWPGPLTLVLTKARDCPIADLATAGLDTVAIRVPSHPVAQALLQAADRPIAAPSANVSGHVSPTTAAHVAADLIGRVAMILDGGATPVGLESTVVDVSGAVPMILRPGGVTREDIGRILGRAVPVAQELTGRPMSPGMLARHYAPHTRVRLNARAAGPGEALLAFGPNAPAHDGPAINLSPSGDLVEAAVNLFSALRDLDASGATAIAVVTFPAYGLGEAINDRLRRAAEPNNNPREDGQP